MRTWREFGLVLAILALGITTGCALVLNPAKTAPSISALSPTTIIAGGPGFVLTVNGTKFDSNTVVLWSGSPRVTTLVSSTNLQAQILRADIAHPGTVQVEVAEKSTSNGGPVQPNTANAVTLTIQPPQMAMVTKSLPNAIVQQAYSAILQASGGVEPYTWSISSGQLPAGLSINSANGLISGKPTAVGQASFNAEVKDAESTPQTLSKAFTIDTTGSASTLQITTVSLANGTAQVSYSASLAASGGTQPYSWTITVGSLPAGLSLNGSTGVISGTPTASGTATFTAQVKDSSATQQSASKQLSIAIAAAGPSPVSITNTSLPGGTAQVSYSATLAASGGTQPYSWTITVGSLPAGLSLNGSTGAISGTPTASGTATFTAQVKDSSATPQSASKQLSIAIAGAGPSPVSITNTSLPGGTAQASYSATLAASGGTTPYSWTISVGSLPAGLSLNGSTGAISGTPTTSGTATFTAQVKDSSATPQSASKQLSIAIAGAGPSPVSITNTSLPGGTAQVSYSATLAASGGTQPYSWTITVGSLPAGLSLNGSTGAISGTPTASGTATFTAQVKDSSATPQSASKQLSIAIAAAAPSPVSITNTSLPGGTAQVSYSATLAASGGTQPYSWTITVGSLPAGLSLNGSTGAISGTPTASGTATFTAQVKDSSATPQSASKQLSITIRATAPSFVVPIKNVFIVMMENTDWSSVKGNSNMPYVNNTLIPNFAHAENYRSFGHPSLPNYVTLEAGNNLGLTNGSFEPTTTNVSTTDHLTTYLNNAGFGWKYYAENLPGGGTTCNLTDPGTPYSEDHNPFVYFLDVQKNTSYCISHERPFSELSTDLTAGTVPSYSFIVPSDWDQGEKLAPNSSCMLCQADSFLSKTIPMIQSSQAYKNGGAILVLWDEGAGCCNNPSGLIVVSSLAKVGYQNSIAYNHGSTVRTMEEIFGLSPFLGGAANATDLSDLFTASNTTPPPTAPTITTGNLPGGIVNQFYSATLAASGGTKPYSWAITVGSLPAGLSLNSSTGAISGTPTTFGTATFTAQVKDSSATPQSASKQLSIAIAAAAPSPVSITTTGLPGGTAQASYNATLAASGGTQPYSWTITVGSLPAGLSLNSSTGAISGTPTASGTATFTAQVKDSSATQQSANKQLSIAIATAAPPPLSITTSSLSSGTVSQSYSATLAASGGTKPYTWSLSSGTLPKGLTLSSAGVISGTPSLAGAFSFGVKVTDSAAGSATATFSITIASTPPPPTGPCSSTAAPPSGYQHVVVFAFENRTWSNVGLGFSPSTMPYIHSLASGCSYFSDWTETNTSQNSLTQYIGETSGVNNSSTVNDCNPSTSCQSTDNNIFRQVRIAGGTARNYVEGATSPCSASGNAAKHVPGLYYFGTYTDGTGAHNDHDFCSLEVVPYSQFDVTNLPTYAFISPTLCNDGHDCGDSTVDNWAKTNIQKVLDSAAYKSGNVAVFVWYDEDHPTPNAQIAPTIHAGQITQSAIGTHAALLKTIELILGLPVMSQGQLTTAADLRAITGLAP